MDDKLNKLFTDFVGRDVLDGISADNFDSLKNDAFITPSNKEFFEDMLRTGWLSGQISSSGPMPNTGFISKTSITSNTRFTLFQPAAGEVWRLTGAELEETAGSATKAGLLEMFDGSDSVRLLNESTGGEIEFSPIPNTIFIDNNVYLVFDASSGFGAGETADVKCSFIRVR
jgi:hypothetical protein